jgi:hypothetical protein
MLVMSSFKHAPLPSTRVFLTHADNGPYLERPFQQRPSPTNARFRKPRQRGIRQPANDTLVINLTGADDGFRLSAEVVRSRLG